MISRREFLKTVMIGMAGLAAGAGAGRLWHPQAGKNLTVHAFLPDDLRVLSEAVAAFYEAAGVDIIPEIIARPPWHNLLAEAYRRAAGGLPPYALGKISLRLSALESGGSFGADLLAGDNLQAIYNPESGFPTSLAGLRTDLRGRQADLLFSAVYSRGGVQDFAAGNKEAMVLIRSEVGLVERFRLGRSYRQIPVSGPQGKTVISIQDGLVWVSQASCRHQLCRVGGAASRPGDVIACAPNKVLIEVEAAG